MATNSKHKNTLLTLQNAGISKTSQRLAVIEMPAFLKLRNALQF
jgi:hypothetical protein